MVMKQMYLKFLCYRQHLMFVFLTEIQLNYKMSPNDSDINKIAN